MNEIRLSDLSMLNIEKKFPENLDFNSVVNTFAKMKTRRKQFTKSILLMKSLTIFLESESYFHKFQFSY